MADVVDLKTKGLVGDGFVFEPDRVLESCKGDFVQVLVVGFDKDGRIAMNCSHGSRDALWLIERARHHLLFETE